MCKLSSTSRRLSRVTDMEATDTSNPNLNYGVVVDCGSSGSRVFVYTWPRHNGNPHDLLDIRQMRDQNRKPVVMKIKPGLCWDELEGVRIVQPFNEPYLDLYKLKCCVIMCLGKERKCWILYENYRSICRPEVVFKDLCFKCAEDFPIVDKLLLWSADTGDSFHAR